MTTATIPTNIALQIPLNTSAAQARYLQQALFCFWKAGVKLESVVVDGNMYVDLEKVKNKLKVVVKDKLIAQL